MVAASMKRLGCPVCLFVLKDVPPAHRLLVREMGFRPAKKTANWWRFYDHRIRQHIPALLHAHETAARLGIKIEVRPVRRSPRAGPTTRDNSTPSAKAWLRQNRGRGKASSAPA
jgi:hypothetical protein